MFFSSDRIPLKGFPIKGRQIVEISKKVVNNNPVTFQVRSGNTLLFLNKKAGITVLPGRVKGQPLSLTITGKISRKS